MNKRYKIVFVVCHPDDEALWIGGLLYNLSQISCVEVTVICLSGKDIGSPREAEFLSAQRIAGYKNGVVKGFPLRKLLAPLPLTSATAEEALNGFGISVREIDILITHSPYGDEHLSPHHTQTCKEMYAWAGKNKVPFGFFSMIPLPFSSHKSLIKNLKRTDTLFLLNFFRCRMSIFRRIFFMLTDGPYMNPSYYLQFLVDLEKKRQMLNCYQSINLEEHKKGYAMFNSNCESIYVMDKKGLQVFNAVVAELDLPGPEDLFKEYSDLRVMASKFYRKFFPKRYSNPVNA